MNRLTGRLGRTSRLVTALRPAYETILSTVSGGNGIPWTLNGETFRIDPRQRHRMAHVYEPELLAALKRRMGKGMTFVDVGANVGVYALQMARVVGPEGRVIAFEPNPGALRYLREHVRMNGLERTVTVVPTAAGSDSGVSTFYADAADGMSRLGAPNPILRASAEMTVPVQTLDGYFPEGGADPDCLLVDVEGFELAVLEGAKNLLNRNRGRLAIFVELHPAAWPSSGASRADAQRIFDEMGLVPVPLTGQLDPLAEYGEVELVWMS